MVSLRRPWLASTFLSWFGRMGEHSGWAQGGLPTVDHRPGFPRMMGAAPQ
jgi:hypothetical protein